MPAGPYILFDQTLEHFVIQAQLRVHLLQRAVFLFKLLQALHIRGFHADVLGFPAVVGRIGDAVLPANFLDHATALDLLQNLDDLGLAVP